MFYNAGRFLKYVLYCGEVAEVCFMIWGRI